MSDDQLKDNLPGEEPDIKGGWHKPTEASLWQPPKDDEDEKKDPFNFWKKMPAFPEDLEEKPEETGGWHLPSPEDTILTPGTEITKGQPIVVEPEPVASSSDGPSPEDMIAQILALQTKPKTTDTGTLVAPEDFNLPVADKPEDTIPEVEADDDETSDEVLEEEVDDLLDSLDDAFEDDERSALISMMEESDEDASEPEGDSPYQAAIRATDDIEQITQEQIDAAETPTPATDDAPAGGDAADYARRMLGELDDDDDEGVSAFSGLISGTANIDQKVETGAGDPGEYARRMLGELGDDGADIGTGVSETYSTQPLNTTPQTPVLDPQTQATAQRFQTMQNQVATLNFRYQNEEMDYEEYQRLLYENMVQDDNGIWWMIGADSNNWYRHNVTTNEWEEDYPPELRALEEYNQAVDGQQSGSVGTQGTTTAYDLPPVYGDPDSPTVPQTPQTPQVGDPMYDQFGVQVGTVQPQDDPQYTVPSDAAFQTSLPDQQQTIPSDPQYIENTIPSASVAGDYDATIPSGAVSYADDGIQSAVDYSAPSDYNLDDEAPIVADYKAQQQSNLTRTLVFAGVGVIALGLVVLIGFSILVALWYSSAVEPYRAEIAALADYNPPFQTARIFDANSDLIVELNSQDTGARTAVDLDQISPFMIHAIISQENERYYEDPGFDLIAIARAFLQNAFSGEIESGASTITQQVARNLVLQDTEVTSSRKINEIVVALEIANNYDKNFILELYLNEVFFGNQSYGVEAASQFYFGHGADELNYAESALLASIVPSPALNDPVVNRPTAIDGMRSTMGKMIDVGCLQFQHGDWLQRGEFCVIPSSTRVNFDGSDVTLVVTDDNDDIVGGVASLQITNIEIAEFVPRDVRMKFPHFVNYIQSEIEAQYGTNALFQRGFNIYTTLQPSVQNAAQDALTERVEQLVDTGVNTGSVMVTDPTTGAIRAMVGSHDFTAEVGGQVNNALTYQQPGSSIKPIVYAGALIGNQGNYLTPASILWDVPVTYSLDGGATYTPVNFDRQYHGAVPLRFALQNSFNIAAVKAYTFLGNDAFLALAQSLGLHFQEGSIVGLASALGANEVRLIDMMQAYGTFANNGQRTDLYSIERITETVDGEAVEVPIAPRPEPVQAISPQVAYLIQNILSDDNARAEEFGTNTNLTLARLNILPTQNRIAAKTGTSNDSRDLWTMGFTRNLVVGVWLGTHDNAPTFNTTGYNSASPVWNTVLEAALRGRPVTEFPNPGGVVAREICRTTGTLTYDGCPERTTDIFIQDKFPPPPDQGFVQNIAVDSWTGLRANEFCDDYVTQQTFASINDPSAVEWLNNTQAGRAFAQVVGLPIPLRAAPEQACSQGQGLPSIGMSFPNANQTIQGSVTIAGQVQAPNFVSYELAYSTAQQPDNFIQISSSTAQVQTNGSPLGTWETSLVANGSYMIRLTVASNTGGSIVVDTPVIVDNPLPTPTPTLVPTVAIDNSTSSGALSAGTAIPFPNAQPTTSP
jgi:membrane peptidoglycan carboxypeptidase